MDGDKVPDNWEIWPSPKIRQLYKMVHKTRDGGIVAVIVNCNTCGKVVEEKPWMVKQPNQNWTDTSNGSFKQTFSSRLGKLKPCCTTAGADAPSKASWLQNDECSALLMPGGSAASAVDSAADPPPSRGMQGVRSPSRSAVGSSTGSSTGVQSTKLEPYYHHSTAPPAPEPPIGALVLRDTSIGELKTRMAELAANGADASELDKLNYGIKMQRAVRDGGLRYRLNSEMSEAMKSRSYELARAMRPPEFPVEDMMRGATSSGMSPEDWITSKIGSFKREYGAQYTEETYERAKAMAEEEWERLGPALDLAVDETAEAASKARQAFEEAEADVRRTARVASMVASEVASCDLEAGSPQNESTQCAAAMAQHGEKELTQAAAALKEARDLLDHAQRERREASKFVLIAKHFNALVAADYPKLSEAGLKQKETELNTLRNQAGDEADRRVVVWDDEKCSKFEATVFDLTYMGAVLRNTSTVSLNAISIDDKSLQQSAARKAAKRRACAARMTYNAAIAAFHAAQSGEAAHAAAAAERRSAAIRERKAAMQEMERVGAAIWSTEASTEDGCVWTSSTPGYIPLRMQFPNPDYTRKEIAIDCGTSTLFTPVAMQAGGIERQPDHLWAPALHAIITHPEARELLHNDDIFSKKGLAGMTAHDWVKSVWPQLGQQRQFEVGSAIRNSSHLIHLLNPPKEWLKQAPEKLLLSREDAMRQQIAQLQALVQMQAAQLRAQNAQQLALPAPVDSPGVLGTRTRDQRDSEGAIDLTSTKRGKAE